MVTLPTPGFFDSGILNSDGRTALDQITAFTRQLVGGSGAAVEQLTISSGSITPVSGHFIIDTESAAPTDDLDRIDQTNLPEDSFIVVGIKDASRVVTLKHAIGGGGQIISPTGQDIVLDNIISKIFLFRKGTTWEVAAFERPEATQALARAGTDQFSFMSSRRVRDSSGLYHMVTNVKTINYTVVASDVGKMIVMNGVSLTLTLPAVIDTFPVTIRNIATTDVTIVPNGANTINGPALLKKDQSVTLVGDSANTRWLAVSADTPILGEAIVGIGPSQVSANWMRVER